MVSPFQKNPLTGIRGKFGVTFFRLDPTGTVPISRLVTLNGNPNQITIDIVDSEDWSETYETTDNALQDFSTATSNSHRNLETQDFTGTLVGAETLLGQRRDLRKIEELRTLAARREPVMVVSPRISMPKAFITALGGNWTPDLGDNSIVSISVKEARIVSPLTADRVVPDLAASATGNNRVTDAGSQAPQADGAGGTSTGVTGQAPTVDTLATGTSFL